MSKWGLRVSKPCGWCGSEMRDKPSIIAKKSFCSRACVSQASIAAKGHKPVVPQPVNCLGCGETKSRVVRANRDSGKYCSSACYHKHRVEWRAAARDARRQAEERRLSLVAPEVQALRRISRYVEKPRLTRLPCSKCGQLAIGVMLHPRTCTECKAEAKRQQAKRSRQSPSGRANRKKHKTIRRARLAIVAELIDPIAVFERDGWKCQLCGIGTPISLRGTNEPRAPELDHVFPLALGGNHTWENVQCACRQCNSKKGATPLGQFNLPMAA